VAAGVADELDQVTPWAPLLRALSSTDPVVLGEDDLAPVRGLLDQRLAVIECIRAAMERASRRRPLLITLDDLQWADPATPLALGSLPVQLFSYPIAWVLALRPVPSSRHLQGLPAALRQALHRDAAAALRRLGAPLVRVAGQYAAGAQPGDEEAIGALTAAAGDLFATAPSAAADLALRVLDLLRDGDQRRPATIALAVGLLGWAGRLDEARDLGERYLVGHDLPSALEAEIEVGMRRAWAMSTSVSYPRPLPIRLVTAPAVPTGVRAHLIAYDQLVRCGARRHRM
jgi:hypothetical protein